MENIYIVGAHSRGQTLAEYIRCLYPNVRTEAFLYDNEEENPQKIGMIPVLNMNKADKLNLTYPVLIGTKGIHHEKLLWRLQQMGFTRIYPVTQKEDRMLRNAYIRKYYAEIGQRFWKIDEPGIHKGQTAVPEKKTSAVYVVRSVFDQPLGCEYEPAVYEKEIQAGAALTDERLYPGILTDDRGDNISGKNGQYCELTALYWIWKHAREEMVGMVHYRRHFMLPKQWTAAMQDHGADVILPVPLYVGPSIAENYKMRHDPADWNFMLDFLKNKDRKLGEAAQTFFEGNLYSPCNMFIMRREILDQFCTWLFPILDAVAAHGGQKKDAYQNRYPGFLSERLMTFYFARKKGCKVVYADKNFLK